MWVAVCYLRSGRRSAFVTLLSAISVGGVALGVAALVTVLAVMNGFENEIQTRIAGTDAHVVILGTTSSGIERREELVAKLRSDRDVMGVAPFTYVKEIGRASCRERMAICGVTAALK